MMQSSLSLTCFLFASALFLAPGVRSQEDNPFVALGEVFEKKIKDLEKELLQQQSKLVQEAMDNLMEIQRNSLNKMNDLVTSIAEEVTVLRWSLEETNMCLLSSGVAGPNCPGTPGELGGGPDENEERGKEGEGGTGPEQQVNHLTKLMVLTGEPNFEVEIFDVKSNEKLLCSKPVDFPHFLIGGAGAFVGGHPVICGGDDGTGPLSTCQGYDPISNEWGLFDSTMQTERVHAAVTIRDPEQGMIISGGKNSNGDIVNSTQFFNTESGASTGKFDPAGFGIDLPTNVLGHCLVNMDNTTFLLAGGYPLKSKTWEYNTDTRVWSEVTPLSEVRHSAFCGLVRKADGTPEVVVAGGFNIGGSMTTEIYSPDTKTWRNGPNLPEVMYQGAVVPYGDSMIVIGGPRRRSAIGMYRYDPDNEAWEMLPMTVKGRGNFVAMMVPDDTVECESTRLD